MLSSFGRSFLRLHVAVAVGALIVVGVGGEFSREISRPTLISVIVAMAVGAILSLSSSVAAVWFATTLNPGTTGGATRYLISLFWALKIPLIGIFLFVASKNGEGALIGGALGLLTALPSVTLAGLRNRGDAA